MVVLYLSKVALLSGLLFVLHLVQVALVSLLNVSKLFRWIDLGLVLLGNVGREGIVAWLD